MILITEESEKKRKKFIKQKQNSADLRAFAEKNISNFKLPEVKAPRKQ